MATIEGMHMSTISVVVSSVLVSAVSEMPTDGRSSLPSFTVGVGSAVTAGEDWRVPALCPMLLFKIVTPENTRAATTPNSTASPATRPIVFAALLFFGCSNCRSAL